mmetsp:Transcript_81908/g.244230  ORF Transcript_81908/g.244230 Transcript_81908/m.244230 type:complete len:259 (+) Transcript_81908:822-1598(+)
MPGWLADGPLVDDRVNLIAHLAKLLPNTPLFSVRQLGDRARRPVLHTVLRIALVAAVRDPLASHAHPEAPALLQRSLPADGAHLDTEGTRDSLPVNLLALAIRALPDPHILPDQLDNVAARGHNVVAGKRRSHVELEEGGAVAILPRRQVLEVCPALAVTAQQIAVPPGIVGPAHKLDSGGHPLLATPFPPRSERIVQLLDLYLAYLGDVGLAYGDLVLLGHLRNRQGGDPVLQRHSSGALADGHDHAPGTPGSQTRP